MQYDLQRGTYVRPVKMRFGTYLLDWVDGLAASGRRPSTIDSYGQNIKRNVLPTLGGKRRVIAKAKKRGICPYHHQEGRED